MSSGERMALGLAEAMAGEVLGLLAPACERIEVAGSIRRRKADVGDIELVAVPKLESLSAGMFGDQTFTVNHLDNRVTELCASGHLTPRTFLNHDTMRSSLRMGPRFKALVYRNFALDLFIVQPPAQFGLLFALRTGPDDFSRLLVTSRRQGGYKPHYLKVVDGGVYYETHKPGMDAPYPCPEEADLFELFHLRYLEPEERRGDVPLRALTTV